MGLITAKDRVREHTADSVNDEIMKRTDAMIEYYGKRPERIPERIKELEHEWDIERTLEANAASFTLLGLVLAFLVSRKWLLLPVVVSAFLLQHSVQGWCPPVPVYRRMGVRTKDEIMKEKVALEMIRGEFDKIPMGKEKPADEKIEALIQAL